jgi:hypothetical protein
MLPMGNETIAGHQLDFKLNFNAAFARNTLWTKQKTTNKP